METRQTKPSSGQTAILRRSNDSRSDEVLISAELIRLAEARQASSGLSEASLEIYSQELSSRFRLDDIRAGLHVLALTRREDGDTAFPDVGTVLAAVREAVRERHAARTAEAKRMRDDAEERHRKEHPEEYVHVSAIIGNFLKNKGIEVIPPAKPKSAFCEHCNGVDLNALRAQDLRALADFIEKRDGTEGQNDGKTGGKHGPQANHETQADQHAG